MGFHRDCFTFTFTYFHCGPLGSLKVFKSFLKLCRLKPIICVKQKALNSVTVYTTALCIYPRVESTNNAQILTLPTRHIRTTQRRFDNGRLWWTVYCVRDYRQFVY